MRLFSKSKIFISIIMLVVLFAPFEQAVLESPVVLSAEGTQQTQQSALNVTVVSLKNTSEVVLNKSSQASFLDCLPVSAVFGGLIQNTAALNLNQPASCFKLSLTQPEVSQSLAVRPLANNSYNAKLKVLVSAGVFIKFIAAASLPLSQPAVPAITILFLAVMATVIFKHAQARFRQRVLRFFYFRPITLEQLSMLRC